jgi:hypothetical protein
MPLAPQILRFDNHRTSQTAKETSKVNPILGYRRELVFAEDSEFKLLVIVKVVRSDDP